MDKITVTMGNPQGSILEEIEQGLDIDNIAISYAWCIKQMDECDFGIINGAIIEKWSKTRLKLIKKKAWEYGG